MIEAITKPDDFSRLPSKYRADESSLTISIKSVVTKRLEDRFFLFVISSSWGSIHTPFAAFRAYPSDVDLNDVNEPLDLVRSFVSTYGLKFQVGTTVSNFVINDVISRHEDNPAVFDTFQSTFNELRVVEGKSGTPYLPAVAFGLTNFQNPEGKPFNEIYMAFVVDIAKYLATLHKHHLRTAPGIESTFPRV